MQTFTEKIISILREIPEGRVASYGQIAMLAGNRRGARQVARVLHSMSTKHQLPWHRVINAKGEIMTKDGNRQKDLLNKEGVIVNDLMQVDLTRYQWQPTDIDIDWLEG